MVELPANPNKKTVRMKSKGKRREEREERERHDWNKIYYL
jgi:hypothetical protein